MFVGRTLALGRAAGMQRELLSSAEALGCFVPRQYIQPMPQSMSLVVEGAPGEGGGGGDGGRGSQGSTASAPSASSRLQKHWAASRRINPSHPCLRAWPLEVEGAREWWDGGVRWRGEGGGEGGERC